MKRFGLSLVALLFAVGTVFGAAANPTNIQNSPLGQTTRVGESGAYIDGGLVVNGSIVQNALGASGAPTVTNSGTTGSTTYTYYCVAQDVNGNEAAPSSSGQTTTGNATLSTTNFNTVTCPGERGAVSFRILKADTAHSLGTCQAGVSGHGCSLVDNSTSAGSGYTAKGTDQTGIITGANRVIHRVTTNTVVSNVAASYMPLDGSATTQLVAAIGDVEVYEPVPHTFKNLYCETTTAGGTVTVAGGTNYVFAFDDVTQSNTSITCTEGAAAPSCSDTTHTYTTTAGDLVAIVDTPNGTPTALVTKCTIEEDF